jgi:hypothetical protein
MPLTFSNSGGLGGLTLTKTTNNVGSLSITQPPTIVLAIVLDGLTLRLDASNSSSYDVINNPNIWNDIDGNVNNTIQLINTPTYTSGTPTYLTFDGTNEWGSGVRGTAGVLSSTSYTKSVWFYLNSYADNNLVSSETGGHYMFFGGGTKMYAGNSNWAGFPNNLQSVTTFSLSTWYNATVTFNTTDGMKLYVNGTLDTTYTTVKTAYTGNGSVNIASYGGGNLLNGRISKVYCYNRSLTAQEVLQNYNYDKSHFGL